MSRVVVVIDINIVKIVDVDYTRVLIQPQMQRLHNQSISGSETTAFATFSTLPLDPWTGTVLTFEGENENLFL